MHVDVSVYGEPRKPGITSGWRIFIPGQPDPKIGYPLVKELAADDGVNITVACRVLKLCRGAYYKWTTRVPPKNEVDNAAITRLILQIHAADPQFGYRLITDQVRSKGWPVSEGRILRLCRKARVCSIITSKRKNIRSGPLVQDDLIKHDFQVDKPDTRWLTDISEHLTKEGKLYVWAVKDLYSNRIVGYSIDTNLCKDLAISALRVALILRGHPKRGDSTLGAR